MMLLKYSLHATQDFSSSFITGRLIYALLIYLTSTALLFFDGVVRSVRDLTFQTVTYKLHPALVAPLTHYTMVENQLDDMPKIYHKYLLQEVLPGCFLSSKGIVVVHVIGDLN